MVSVETDQPLSSPDIDKAMTLNMVHEQIKLGLVNAENYDYDTRTAFRNAYMAMPIREPDGYGGTRPTDQVVDIMEGREYCYATNARGYFGVFSLDEASRAWLHGATLHLWHDELGPDGTWREDFDADTALGVYQEEAMQSALQKGVAV